MKNINVYYMNYALLLANRGRQTVSPNLMVGCIIVKNGAIISEGWNSIDFKNHAEIYALKKAGIQAKYSTVYVSSIPCDDQVRSISCTDALIKSGVKKIIIATSNPKSKVSSNSIKKFRNAGIEVTIGVLERQAKQLNKIFFHYYKTKKPFVYAKWAMSLDGKIAVNTGDYKNISSNESFIYTHKLRNICDAILIGRQTLIEDNPMLNVRIKINNIRNPIRFVLFSKINEIDFCWKVLNQNVAKTIFVCNDISNKAEIKLNQLGIEYWVLGCQNKEICLETLLEKIGKIGITSLLVEGGKKTLNNFINKRLINEFYTYISPVIIAEHNPKEYLYFDKLLKIDNDVFINSSFKENKTI